MFAHGQTFTYGLEDIGKYYRDYVRLMDHWDVVLPGRVHRVQYEEMVADTEAQIRALLDYCELDFEEQCLRFYETDRAVRTPSSEQVRKPIYKEGLEQWRNFEAHLDPLKEALGPEVRQRYSIDLLSMALSQALAWTCHKSCSRRCTTCNPAHRKSVCLCAMKSWPRVRG